MTAPIRSIRRATLDDLPQLIPLWKLENLPVHEFERRFKEFQVAESETGELLGAVGVQVVGSEVRIHGEAFAQFEFADEMRARFWDRLRVMGENQGWVRAWTDLTSQAWRGLGFDPAPPELLARVPDAFGHAVHGVWHVVVLREERPRMRTVELEFQRLKLMNQEEHDRTLKRARLIRNLGFLLVGSFIAWFSWNVVRYLRNRKQIGPR